MFSGLRSKLCGSCKFFKKAAAMACRLKLKVAQLDAVIPERYLHWNEREIRDRARMRYIFNFIYYNATRPLTQLPSTDVQAQQSSRKLPYLPTLSDRLSVIQTLC
jgi:hypothetical protein